MLHRYRNETQQKNISINGVEIREVADSSFAVLTFQKANDTEVVIGDRLSISIDGVTKYFYAFLSEKKSKDVLYFECRGVSAFLDEPFETEDTVYEPCQNITELVEYYSQKYGVEIDYRGVFFEFGETYLREGTPLDSLKNIATVAGCEMYDDCENEKIVIEPYRGILDDSILIEDCDILNFIPDSRITARAKIGAVDIGKISPEITSTAKCSTEIDSCTGYGIISTVPKNSIIKQFGFQYLHQGIIEYSEVLSVSATEQKITTKYPIQKILECKINGISQTTLDFVEDTVILPYGSVGLLEIKYNAYCYLGKMNSIDKLGNRGFKGNVIYGKVGFEQNENLIFEKSCSTDSSIDGEVSYDEFVFKNYRVRVSKNSIKSGVRVKVFDLSQNIIPAVVVVAIDIFEQVLPMETNTKISPELVFREKLQPTVLETPHNGYNYVVSLDFEPKSVSIVESALCLANLPFEVVGNRIYVEYAKPVYITYRVDGVAQISTATTGVKGGYFLNIYIENELALHAWTPYDSTAPENIRDEPKIDIVKESELSIDDFADTKVIINDDYYTVDDSGCIHLDPDTERQTITTPETDPCLKIDVKVDKND
jgi:hypothetical protein